MKYYYGGIVASGRVIKRGKGYALTLVTSVPDAALLALSAKGNVYEIKPVGRIIPDPEGEPGIYFLARRAKVVRQLAWGEVRQHLKFRIADGIEAQSTEEGLWQEVAVQE